MLSSMGTGKTRSVLYAADYLIRVNRLPASADQKLQDGDRVSMTPTKIEGAALAA